MGKTSKPSSAESKKSAKSAASKKSASKPASADASKPASPAKSDASKPASADASKPASADASKPASPVKSDASKPASADASKPVSPDASKPASADASKPASPAKSDASADASNLASADASKSASPDASKPASADASKPASPAKSDTSKPASADASKPASADASKPASPARSEADTTLPDPTEPISNDSTSDAEADAEVAAVASLPKQSAGAPGSGPTKAVAGAPFSGKPGSKPTVQVQDQPRSSSRSTAPKKRTKKPSGKLGAAESRSRATSRASASSGSGTRTGRSTSVSRELVNAAIRAKRTAAVRTMADVPLSCGLGVISVQHEYLTSLEGLGLQPDLQSLYLQFNNLSSFSYLGKQPNLVTLHVGWNKFTSLHGLQPMPKLEALYMNGNPICEHDNYRVMALLAVGWHLRSIDGTPLQHHERVLARSLHPMAAECVRHGWLLDFDARSDQDWTVLIDELRSSLGEPIFDVAERVRADDASDAAGSGSGQMDVFRDPPTPLATRSTSQAGGNDDDRPITLRLADAQNTIADLRRHTQALERQLRDKQSEVNALMRFVDVSRAPISIDRSGNAQIARNGTDPRDMADTIANQRKEMHRLKVQHLRDLKVEHETIARLQKDLAHMDRLVRERDQTLENQKRVAARSLAVREKELIRDATSRTSNHCGVPTHADLEDTIALLRAELAIARNSSTPTAPPTSAPVA